jgi:hypothetical protein
MGDDVTIIVEWIFDSILFLVKKTTIKSHSHRIMSQIINKKNAMNAQVQQQIQLLVVGDLDKKYSI